MSTNNKHLHSPHMPNPQALSPTAARISPSIPCPARGTTDNSEHSKELMITTRSLMESVADTRGDLAPSTGAEWTPWTYEDWAPPDPFYLSDVTSDFQYIKATAHNDGDDFSQSIALRQDDYLQEVQKEIVALQSSEELLTFVTPPMSPEKLAKMEDMANHTGLSYLYMEDAGQPFMVLSKCKFVEEECYALKSNSDKIQHPWTRGIVHPSVISIQIAQQSGHNDYLTGKQSRALKPSQIQASGGELQRRGIETPKPFGFLSFQASIQLRDLLEATKVAKPLYAVQCSLEGDRIYAIYGNASDAASAIAKLRSAIPWMVFAAADLSCEYVHFTSAEQLAAFKSELEKYKPIQQEGDCTHVATRPISPDLDNDFAFDREGVTPPPAREEEGSSTKDPSLTTTNIQAPLRKKRKRIIEMPIEYKCPIGDCDQTFRTNKECRLHKETHQDRPYICNFANCGKRFLSKKDLKRHERSVHKIGEEG